MGREQQLIEIIRWLAARTHLVEGRAQRSRVLVDPSPGSGEWYAYAADDWGEAPELLDPPPHPDMLREVLRALEATP